MTKETTELVGRFGMDGVMDELVHGWRATPADLFDNDDIRYDYLLDYWHCFACRSSERGSDCDTILFRLKHFHPKTRKWGNTEMLRAA